ncbi:hypothetical protein SNEBB_005297 [Seison nebaliae]|nr:hypothetical protein SNEBB_005297 [Seison nebaliae]
MDNTAFHSIELNETNIEQKDTQSVPNEKSIKKRITTSCIFIVCGCIIAITVILAVILSVSPKEDDKKLSISEIHENYVQIPSKWAEYQSSALASDTPLCGRVGQQIEKLGGNAVEMAIATAFCTGIQNMHSMGIGGGSFWVIYWKPENKVYVFNGREEAPASASQHMFDKDIDGSRAGPNAIGIPGEVKLYSTIFNKFKSGYVTWAQLVQPTIDMAEQGSPVSSALAKAINSTLRKKVLNSTTYNPLREFLINPKTKKAYVKDDIIVLRKLATTLRLIAVDPETFYSGVLAKRIVSDIKDEGGNITEKDMEQYHVRRPEPLFVNIGENRRMYTLPFPSSGPVLAFIMKMMNRFYGKNKVDNIFLFYHRFVEAMKFGAAKRSEFGDQMNDEKNIDNDVIKGMLSDDNINEIFKKIKNDTTLKFEEYGAKFSDTTDRTGTAHLSVVDSNGNAVSSTHTVNLYFGSKVIGRRTGIIFNDEMDDFSNPLAENFFGVPPSKPNFIKAGKQPLSSMTPAIVVDGNNKIEHIIGASGGTRIFTTTAQILSEVFFRGRDIVSCIDEKRIHDQLMPKVTYLERGFNETIKKHLKEMGHDIEMNGSMSVAQCISRTRNNTYIAVCDGRKGGTPYGRGMINNGPIDN